MPFTSLAVSKEEKLANQAICPNGHIIPATSLICPICQRNLKDREATPMLLKIVKDQDDYTRLYAVLLLGNIGDQRALDDLKQIANTDPNRKIRKSAAWAIAVIQKRG